MSVVDTPPVTNRLLGGLPSKDHARVLQHCESVELVFGSVLCEARQPFRYAYFPLTGFISQVASVGGHKPLETGLIGNEGMLGATLALGVRTAAQRGVVQGPGSALRMSVAHLLAELRQGTALRRALNRYLYLSMAQLAQIAACTCFHAVQARLARWLLMTHDRVVGDRFDLTHDFLADMLGVRRSAVTIAAGALQRRKLIRYARGRIVVLDRAGLEAAACECYRTQVADYARVLGKGMALRTAPG